MRDAAGQVSTFGERDAYLPLDLRYDDAGRGLTARIQMMAEDGWAVADIAQRSTTRSIVLFQCRPR